MKYGLNELALETTRRCNLTCPGYCMRGPSQKCDLTPEIIDTIFANNDISYIRKICFSGGEPTLNPDIIVYTIDKIIRENIPVYEVVLVTNGQIYSPEIVDAFNRFNEYRNEKLRISIMKDHKPAADLEPNMQFLSQEEMIKGNTDGHARITFSIDEYHAPIKEEVRAAYQRDAKGLTITDWKPKPEDIYKTGFASDSPVGKEFTYELDPLRYMNEGNDERFILDTIYMTVNGHWTTEGMGSYVNMDINNCGHVNDITIKDLIDRLGVDKSFGSKKTDEIKLI